MLHKMLKYVVVCVLCVCGSGIFHLCTPYSDDTMLKDNAALAVQYLFVLSAFIICMCNWELLFGSPNSKEKSQLI